MKERVLAAIGALIIVLPLLIWGGLWGMFILGAVACYIATGELRNMLLPDSKHLLLPLQGVYLVCFSCFSFLNDSHTVAILGLASISLWIIALFREDDNEKGMQFAIRSTFGIIYIPLLLSTFVLLRSLEDGLAWIFLVFLITWSADTGAYFAGRFLGKNKLFPRVSPKKTIEGVIGGIVLSIVVSIWFMGKWLEDVSIIHAVILGIGLAIFSVIGDLVESMIKRATGVKDSGNLMPGHGGIVDRLDSLLFTFPLTYCYVTWFLGVAVQA